MKYKHETGLGLDINHRTGNSEDSYARQFGWSFDVWLDYDQYRTINDHLQDTGQTMDAFLERCVKREIRRMRIRSFWNRLKSLLKGNYYGRQTCNKN